jgi:ABC-type ATPase involved in cell division
MDGDHLPYNNYDHSVLATLGNGELVPLTHEDRRQHVFITGKTGTGTSTLLFNLMFSDLRQGRGFALLDPHGDLEHAIADAVPPERTNEVLYFDPADLSHSVAFNPLEAGDRERG